VYDSFGTGDGDLNASAKGRGVPGPGNYEAHASTLASPLRKNGPAFSFGGKNVTRGKVVARANKIDVAPGDYSSKSGLGSQCDSRKATSSTYKFGAATREGDNMVCSAEGGTVSKGARHNPGPGSYQAKSSLGHQRLSTKSSPAMARFGKSLRPDETKRNSAVPGPGAYGVHDSVGRQKLSKRKTSPTYVFGTSTRSPLVTNVG